MIGWRMICGMAVDLMRYEQTRTTLQHTLDRSTLAAASLSQDLNAIDVVNDYFEKAGLLQYLTNVQVDEGINFKEVTAQLATVNRSADRRVTPLLRPGKAAGTTEVDLTVEDQRPLHASLELNNKFSPDTTATA